MVQLLVDVSGQRGRFEYRWQLETPVDGVVGVFGPNGAGKTSLLRAIAGLDRSTRGRLSLGDQIWLDSAAGIEVPTHRRGVGYVFQDGRLLPHLGVRGNLQYASRRAPAERGWFDDVVSGLDLEPLMSRGVHDLSGGERQRVAIARALLSRPALLLMDEPLSANDLSRRRVLLPYLRRIANEFRIPTLYVSHSLDEMVALTEAMLICREGQIVAQGPTAELAQRSDLREVSDIPEAGAALSAQVVAIDRQTALAELNVGQHRFSVPSRGLTEGDEVRLQIHARDVAIALDPPSRLSIRNVLPAEVVSIDDPGFGTYADVVLDIEGAQLRSRVTRAAIMTLPLTVGQPCFALVKAASIEEHPAFDLH
jgi:molybdate transport system ATP-binding protein